jgi:hypothetical protein
VANAGAKIRASAIALEGSKGKKRMALSCPDPNSSGHGYAAPRHASAAKPSASSRIAREAGAACLVINIATPRQKPRPQEPTPPEWDQRSRQGAG